MRSVRRVLEEEALPLKLHRSYPLYREMEADLRARIATILDGVAAEAMKVLAAHDGSAFDESYNLLNAWLATIPGNASPWREVKVYQVRDAAANRWRAYAYVATEAANSGLQTIDIAPRNSAAESVEQRVVFVDKARKYATERIVFDRPIGRNQGVQFPIAESYIELEAESLDARVTRTPHA